MSKSTISRTDPNPSGMCMCGCGSPTNVAKHHGGIYDVGHHSMYLPGHSRRKSGVEYVVDPETGCWVWQLAVGAGGYGIMRDSDSVYVRAHRYYYERENGPIPDGMVLDHLCRNTRCVNPAHLESVQQADNVRRGKATRFSNRDVCAIRWLVSMGVSRYLVAEMFGTSYGYVGDLVRGFWAASVSCPSAPVVHNTRRRREPVSS